MSDDDTILYGNLVKARVGYNLETCPERFKETIKNLGLNPDEFTFVSGGDACTHYLKFDDGEEVAIVTILPQKTSTEITFALIVHEATHVWQYNRRALSEDKPSSEFEAYSMQTICFHLFSEYLKQTKNA